jgi:hypothetical protein
VPHCHFDGGASERILVTPADFNQRFSHLSISGLAKLADAEWAAMKRAHVV